MLICALNANNNGYRAPIQSWEQDEVPDGYIQVHCPIQAFTEAMGFVDLVISDGVVVDIIPNIEAKKKYLRAVEQSELESTPENEQSSPSEIQRLRADLDYLSAITGVEL